MNAPPSSVRSILDALCFDGRPFSLADLDRDGLDFADRAQLTPILASFDLPPAARAHVEGALANNAIRVIRVAAAYEEIAPAFDHVVLKGFTHVPDFVDDLRLRTQYDLDLYVPAAQGETARNALLSLGYEPIAGIGALATDQLPTMVRKTGWEWRGDYFDPDIPVSIEVHFEFWNASIERLRPAGLDNFWTRRDGNRLNPVDRLGYAALHLTRHLLRGQVRAFHVWELARFLNFQHDERFWQTWKEWHPPSLRRLEAIAFLLASSWFACDLQPEVQDEIGALPEAVRRWFEIYAWSPLEGTFSPNKHELWLHLSLIEGASERLRVLGRRLLPRSWPGPVDAVHLPPEQMTSARRMKQQTRYLAYVGSRAIRHARLFVPTLSEGFRWWLRTRQ